LAPDFRAVLPFGLVLRVALGLWLGLSVALDSDLAAGRAFAPDLVVLFVDFPVVLIFGALGLACDFACVTPTPSRALATA
jgi:hypothetical protein